MPLVLVNVCEAINETLHERLIAFTSKTVLDEARVMRACTGWSPKHAIVYRLVIQDIPLSTRAPVFVEDYARAMRAQGWKAATDMRHWP